VIGPMMRPWLSLLRHISQVGCQHGEPVLAALALCGIGS